MSSFSSRAAKSMITRKEAEARISSGGTLSMSELKFVVLSTGAMTAIEMEHFLSACPEWIAEKREREAAINAKEVRYLKEETPLRDDLHQLGFSVKWVWDFVNAKENYYSAAIPTLIDHLQRPYNDEIREGIARSLAIKEARGRAGPAIIAVLRESGLSDQLRWALANTLATVAVRSDRDGIKAILATETNTDVVKRLNTAWKNAAKS